MIDHPTDEPVKLAVTVDDLFQWRNVPFPNGYDARRCSRALTDAFADHGVREVYAFSCTHPTDDDPSLLEVLDSWCAAGHHVGSHTHMHCSCNWLPADAYLADVDRGDEVLEPWLERSPTRYFRHAFVHAGDTSDKVIQLSAGLARRGFRVAPITSWFYDVQFMVPYVRAVNAGDDEAAALVQDRFVAAALSQFRRRVETAKAIFGRVPAQIGLVHGTAIAADAYGRVLEALREDGVQFVTLDEAMQDPVNVVEPHVTRRFRDHMQKWATAAGVAMEGVPPMDTIEEVRAVCPVEGLMEHDVFAASLGVLPEAMGARMVIDDLDPQ